MPYKLQGRRGRPQQTILLLRKLDYKWSFARTDFLFRFVTIHAFDRRTDRQTDGQWHVSRD